MAPMKCPAQRDPADAIDDSYSLTYLAHRWGVQRKVIRRLLQQGALPFVQIEGQLRVPAKIVRIMEKKD